MFACTHEDKIKLLVLKLNWYGLRGVWIQLRDDRMHFLRRQALTGEAIVVEVDHTLTDINTEDGLGMCS